MQPIPTLDQASPGTNSAVSVRFPGEDGGHSLAAMAQRDLDAALQLLADRAQYITGASGAAIAIRRDGRNDMLCRASSGMNAPELGALLSTEFGLSGESVRTRQALRCDDAERDRRVNREVCREMGIASVVVMPVVNDDEVLGVLELFSGKANAFGARDVSAVQRLSEMVETAVRLAQAAENLPERLKLKMSAISAAAVEEVDVEEVEVEVLEYPPVLENRVRRPIDEQRSGPSGAKAQAQKEELIAALEALRHPKTSSEASPVIFPDTSPTASSEISPLPSPETAAPKKTLFWSAALNAAADTERAEEPDQSHVPPVLRSLHKCEACGFPVSAGRMLCVECEEKKWRGQLKPAGRRGKIPSAVSGAAVSKPDPKPEARAFAAAAQSGAATSAPATHRISATVAASGTATALPFVQAERGKESAGKAMAVATASKTPGREAAIEPAARKSEIPPSASSSDGSSVQSSTASSEFVFSAGLEPSQSWLGTNKYIVGVLLVIAAAIAAAFLLR